MDSNNQIPVSTHSLSHGPPQPYLSASFNKPYRFASAVKSLRDIERALHPKISREALSHLQGMAASITERYLDKKKGRQESFVARLSASLGLISQQSRVEELNKRIQYYLASRESLLPYLFPEVEQNVLNYLSLPDLCRMSLVSRQGGKLAEDAICRRARALGYRGESAAKEAGNYLKKMKEMFDALLEFLPERCLVHNSPHSEQMLNWEQSLLKLKTIDDEELVSLLESSFLPGKNLNTHYYPHWQRLARYLCLYLEARPEGDRKIDKMLTELSSPSDQKEMVSLLLKRGGSIQYLQNYFSCVCGLAQEKKEMPTRLLIDVNLERLSPFLDLLLSYPVYYDFNCVKWKNFLQNLVQLGEIEFLDRLFQKGLSPDFKVDEVALFLKHTEPLSQAISELKNPSLERIFIKTQEDKIKSLNQQTSLLQLALQCKSLALIQAFIAAEVNIDENWLSGHTPLSYALFLYSREKKKGQLLEVIHLLLSSGANPNQIPFHLNIPFNVSALCLLIDFNLSLEEYGKELLIQAIGNHQLDEAELLLQKKPDLNNWLKHNVSLSIAMAELRRRKVLSWDEKSLSIPQKAECFEKRVNYAL